MPLPVWPFVIACAFVSAIVFDFLATLVRLAIIYRANSKGLR